MYVELLRHTYTFAPIATVLQSKDNPANRNLVDVDIHENFGRHIEILYYSSLELDRYLITCFDAGK